MTILLKNKRGKKNLNRQLKGEEIQIASKPVRVLMSLATRKVEIVLL